MPKTLRKNRKNKREKSKKRVNNRRNRSAKKNTLRGGMFTHKALPHLYKTFYPSPPPPTSTSTPQVPVSDGFSSLSGAIREYPITASALLAGAAGATGAGYYLTRESEGVKNAKDYIRIIKTIKKKTEDLENEIEIKKIELGEELGQLDPEGLVYNNQNWRRGFYNSVLREIGNRRIDEDTVLRAKNGTGINSIKLFNDLLSSTSDLDRIKNSLYSIYGPDRPDNVILAPQPYRDSIRRGVGNSGVPINDPQVLGSDAPPPQPNGELLTQKLRTFYEYYRQRWILWNRFVQDNPNSLGANGQITVQFTPTYKNFLRDNGLNLYKAQVVDIADAIGEVRRLDTRVDQRAPFNVNDYIQ